MPFQADKWYLFCYTGDMFAPDTEEDVPGMWDSLDEARAWARENLKGKQWAAWSAKLVADGGPEDMPKEQPGRLH